MVRLKSSKIKRIKLKELKPRPNLKWTKEQLAMKPEIIQSYNPRIGIIVITKDNKILDGNHRYHILIEHYGGEHEVIVKQRRFKRRYYVLRAWFRLIILSPILVPIIIYKAIWRQNL